MNRDDGRERSFSKYLTAKSGYFALLKKKKKNPAENKSNDLIGASRCFFFKLNKVMVDLGFFGILKYNEIF